MKERVFGFGCKRGGSASADLSTMWETRHVAGSLTTVDPNQTPMKKIVHYIGLDVHKD
jgi:hypothetical protein